MPNEKFANGCNSNKNENRVMVLVLCISFDAFQLYQVS